MTNDRPVKRRHVRVTSSGDYQRPGLVIAWRRTDASGWEAYVAQTHHDGSALITWESATSLRPVTDDGWELNRKGPRR